MKTMKGYKIFNHDWTCGGFQFEVGKTFEKDVKQKICENGFHFCERGVDCLDYYTFNTEDKIAEVIALGEIDNVGKISYTNKIKIVREIKWQEFFEIVNIGEGCTGFYNNGNNNNGDNNNGDNNNGHNNNGDNNNGDFNNGDANNGNANNGHFNNGNANNGNFNDGDDNNGNNNNGYANNGDFNNGSRNIGDWNKTSCSNGCFNTEQQKIFMFNKISDWTYQDWLFSNAKYILDQIPANNFKWVREEDMTDDEKKEHSEYKVTGGFLKHIEEKTKRQMWWNTLYTDDKESIMNLPNFDEKIFEEMTGIKVTK